MKKLFLLAALASAFVFFAAGCGANMNENVQAAYWDAFHLNKRAKESIGDSRSLLIEKLGPPTTSRSEDDNIEILTFYQEALAHDIWGDYVTGKRYCTAYVTLRNDIVESVEKGPCRLHH